MGARQLIKLSKKEGQLESIRKANLLLCGFAHRDFSSMPGIHSLIHTSILSFILFDLE
ncbi:MAG: hypothetical protein QXI39_09555 [Candidatus Bathyarchaeia archaeon]